MIAVFRIRKYNLRTRSRWSLITGMDPDPGG